MSSDGTKNDGKRMRKANKRKEAGIKNLQKFRESKVLAAQTSQSPQIPESAKVGLTDKGISMDMSCDAIKDRSKKMRKARRKAEIGTKNLQKFRESKVLAAQTSQSPQIPESSKVGLTDKMSEKLVLYGTWKSSCSWRVRAVLAYKNIEYELKPIDMDKGEQFHPEYLKINPAGMVPTLVHNNNVLTESLAIMEYIEEVYKGKPKILGGKDAVRSAQIRSISLSIIAGIQPLQIPRVFKKTGRDEEFAKEMILTGFEVLEKRLKVVAGRFCVGDELSMADFCLVPQVYNAIVKFALHLQPFPLISRLYSDLVKFDCIKTTHPTSQPDFNTPSPLLPVKKSTFHYKSFTDVKHKDDGSKE